MRAERKESEALSELDANQIVRQADGWKYFGYGHSRLEELIRAGKIPKPFPLVEGGRAKGWLGRQIIEHHRQRLAEIKS